MLKEIFQTVLHLQNGTRRNFNETIRNQINEFRLNKVKVVEIKITNAIGISIAFFYEVKTVFCICT